MLDGGNDVSNDNLYGGAGRDIFHRYTDLGGFTGPLDDLGNNEADAVHDYNSLEDTLFGHNG